MHIAWLQTRASRELLTIWLWDKIKPEIPMLSKIELDETPTSGAVYRGE